jgi:hypothetical protein
VIVVPYAGDMLRDETYLWAVRHHAVMRRLPPTDDAYWAALCDWWIGSLLRAYDLVVVEQDILPAEGVVDEMLACPEPWCTSPYPRVRPPGDPDPGLLEHGLGCAKFSAGLIEKHSGLMISAGEPVGEAEPIGAWWMMDARLNNRLRKAGYTPHLHRPSEHLHQ